jgi:hypothetical protein
LTPVEELDNPQWWLPDVIIFMTFLALSYGGVYYYSSVIQEELAIKEADKQRIIQETGSLDSDVEKFNSLNTKISALASKKTSLQQITESKLMRYLPIILLENIQNLKPEDIWLDSLAFVEKKPNDPNALPPTPGAPPSMGAEGGGVSAPPPVMAENQFQANDFPVHIEINGKGKSNVAVAEFMMALKATQNQRFEKSDLRTQLFFSDVAIAFTQVSTQPARTESPDAVSPEIVEFKLTLSFRERIGVGVENTAQFDRFIEDFKRNGQASLESDSKAKM